MRQRAQLISAGHEKRNKLIVGNVSGLGETIHAAWNFDVHIAVVKQRPQIILFNDGLGEQPDGDAHILIAFHGHTEVEIFEIRGQEFCIWCGDYAVDQDFGGHQVGGFGADFEGVVDFVTADSPTLMMWIRFLEGQRRHNAEVSGFATSRIGEEDRNEKDGSICAFDGAVALCEASDFVAIGTLPNRSVTALTELAILSNFARVGVDGMPV